MVGGDLASIPRPAAIDPLVKEHLGEGLQRQRGVACPGGGNGLEGLRGQSGAPEVCGRALGCLARWLRWLLTPAWWLLELLGRSQGIDACGERVDLRLEVVEPGPERGDAFPEVLRLLRLLRLPGEVVHERAADNGC